MPKPAIIFIETMKSLTLILTIVFLSAVFVGAVNPQIEDSLKNSTGNGGGGESNKQLGNQPKSIIQLLVYWLAILIVAYIIARLCNHLLNQLANRIKKTVFLLRLLLPILRATIYGCALYVIFSGIIRRAEGGIYIIIGALAIVFGLALKDLFSSLVGGFVLLFDRSFRIGDRIKVDNCEGEVTSMGLCSVKMITSDGQSIVIPNSSFFRQTIANTTADVKDSTVEVELILPNYISLEQMEKVAKEAALTSKYVYLAEPVLITSTDYFQGIFLTKLKVKASVFNCRYATQFAEDIKKRVKAELR